MIWIIGGTKDSRILVEKLVNCTKEIVVSVSTQYGKKLLLDYNIKIIDKKLSKEEKKVFIKSNNIKLIIDASHPFAQNVSKSMIDITKECEIEYLRFERPLLKYEDVNYFDDIKSMVKYINQETNEGNILSTLGSNNLEQLKNIEQINRLFIRVLPVSNSLIKAEDMGFLAKNIIAIQGPFSLSFNKAIFENYNIKYLLTKESGSQGGEEEKILASRETKTKILILKRPKVNYPKMVDSIDEVIKFIKEKVS